jgi:hypothetical protein
MAVRSFDKAVERGAGSRDAGLKSLTDNTNGVARLGGEVCFGELPHSQSCRLSHSRWCKHTFAMLGLTQPS